MKIVSQLNSVGYFVGPVVADESPMEPGVFLIPGGAVDAPPPNIPAGKVALWQGWAWAFVLPPDEVQEENPPIDGVPQSVTMRQARLALLGAGLLDSVNAAIAAITDATQQQAAEIEWEYAQTVDRASPFTQQLASGLGLTSEQLDSLFTQAAAL